jgi:pimeloyl-ACP methyl ester carboxylesterase
VRELAPHHQVIAMDQRNAGRSRAPIEASDGWETYASDHVALLDHLGIDQCHVLGGCIGGAFALRLAASHPARVGSLVLQQPIGFSGANREAFHRMFDDWAAELAGARPDVGAAALAGLRVNLYGGDFAFSVSRDDVRRCQAPILVLRGNDVYHPVEVSEEIARLAPRAELVASWKEGDDLARAVTRVKEFMGARHA